MRAWSKSSFRKRFTPLSRLLLRLLPPRLRRIAERAKVLKPFSHQAGVYLGVWRRWGRFFYLRDCGPSHILVFAPTRSGKGVGIVIPTLLTWPHSALIHDLKGENWALTSGARQRMGQICLKYAPASSDEDGARFNPLAEVRLRTPHEIRDVRNIAQMNDVKAKFAEQGIEAMGSTPAEFVQFIEMHPIGGGVELSGYDDHRLFRQFRAERGQFVHDDFKIADGVAVVGIAGIHQMCDQARALQVFQETRAQACSFMGAFDQAGNIRDDE